MIELFFAFMGAGTAIAFGFIPNKCVGVLFLIILVVALFLRWVVKDSKKWEE